jgi:hypothetical protein
MLNSKNLKMHRLTKQFDHQILELFSIDKLISSMAVKCRIVESELLYLEFHVKVLELYCLR